MKTAIDLMAEAIDPNAFDGRSTGWSRSQRKAARNKAVRAIRAVQSMYDPRDENPMAVQIRAVAWDILLEAGEV